MGVFSWTCAHCKHSILGHSDPGINDWMQDAVVLTESGDVHSGTYGGYGDLGCAEITDEMYNGAVMVHVACWEVAGKPDFAKYTELGLKSEHARDQGYFFDDEHDVIDPRITDGIERERLLTEGRAARERRHFDQKAQDVGQALADAKRKAPEDRWQVLYSIWEPQGHQTDYKIVCRILGMNVIDRQFDSKESAEAHARDLYVQWLESEEFQQLHARAIEMRDESRRAYVVQLKLEGRYNVSDKRAEGDTTITGDRTREATRVVSTVWDRLTFKNVALMDSPIAALGCRTFVVQAGTDNSEWMARVTEVQAAMTESHRLATAEAARLNSEWASAGYPLPDIEWED